MTNLEPVNVGIAIASIIFGTTAAAYIGPYAAIILASTVGAAWALRRKPRVDLVQPVTFAMIFMQAFKTIWYFSLVILTAVVVTVGLATLLSSWFKIEDGSWMLSPIALLVGGVGDDWPRILKWAAMRLMRLTERRPTENN